MTYTATHAAPRGNSLRLALMLPAAALVTACLFLVMGGLIKSDDIMIGEPSRTEPINITRELPPQGPEQVDPIDTKLTETPPPVAPREWTVDGPGPVDYGTPSKPITGETGTDGPIGPITASAAVLQFNPDYPPRCAARGVEGRVTVVFDVLANGSVANQRIVNSSDSCFNRAALQAIADWKFMPSGGGTGIVQRGVRKTFVFTLQG